MNNDYLYKYVFYSTVNLLARLWRREIPGKLMEAREFSLPNEHAERRSFIDKYDKNQQQLQTLAARDDLSGMSTFL